MTHVRVWKFRPPPAREADFAQAYCATGRWAALFARAPGFRGTILLEPAQPGDWWMTLDRWRSAEDFAAFNDQYGSDYRALDAELEGVAGEEAFVGAFEEFDAGE
jgi:heme-degrading monooxygenase HmoA